MTGWGACRRYADELLKNLWRWLCSPATALACPALHRAVASLMRKCLAQLVADLRRLGATVVAADATSVILATGKRNLSAAVGWETLPPALKTLKSNHSYLFHFYLI